MLSIFSWAIYLCQSLCFEFAAMSGCHLKEGMHVQPASVFLHSHVLGINGSQSWLWNKLDEAFYSISLAISFSEVMSHFDYRGLIAARVGWRAFAPYSYLLFRNRARPSLLGWRRWLFRCMVWARMPWIADGAIRDCEVASQEDEKSDGKI